MKYFLLSLIAVFLISVLWYFQKNQQQEIFYINFETTYTDDFLVRNSLKTNGHNVWTKDSVFCEVAINDKIFSGRVSRLEFWNHIKIFDSDRYSFIINVNKQQDTEIHSFIESKPFKTTVVDFINGYTNSYHYISSDSTIEIVRYVTMRNDVNSFSYEFKLK